MQPLPCRRPLTLTAILRSLWWRLKRLVRFLMDRTFTSGATILPPCTKLVLIRRGLWCMCKSDWGLWSPVGPHHPHVANSASWMRRAGSRLSAHTSTRYRREEKRASWAREGLLAEAAKLRLAGLQGLGQRDISVAILRRFACHSGSLNSLQVMGHLYLRVGRCRTVGGTIAGGQYMTKSTCPFRMGAAQQADR